MPDTPRYKFLLAIDGSTHADRAAEYLARRAGRLRPCEVHLVNVQPPQIYGSVVLQRNDLLLDAADATVVARRYLDAAGIAYRFHTELGDPVQGIVDLVQSQACDEVILGTRGMGAIDSITIGSVAYKAIHLSTVPVTVVPNPHDASELELEDGDEVHRVLLAVDGSKTAAIAAEYVCALRDAHIPIEVHLVNVQLPIASGNVRRFVAQETIDNYCRAEGQAALEAARKSLQSAGLVFEDHVLIGHPGTTIVSQSHQWGCTRIVMGTRGMGALASTVLGSTALQVVHRSEIPVTLVK